MLESIFGFLILTYLAHGASLFDAKGQLAQVELALKAADSGGSILSAQGHDIVVAVCWTPQKMQKGGEVLREPSQCRILSETVGFCSTGVRADATHLCQRLFDDVNSHEQLYRSTPVLGRLARGLASYVHESSLSMRHRPFGVRALVLGQEVGLASTTGNSGDSGGRPALYEIDPLGNCYTVRVAALGPHAPAFMKRWGTRGSSSSANHDDERNSGAFEAPDVQMVDPLTMEAADLVLHCMRVLREGILGVEDTAIEGEGHITGLQVMVGGPAAGRVRLLSAEAVAAALTDDLSTIRTELKELRR
jgi:20S proteasome alpha/beta subunit